MTGQLVRAERHNGVVVLSLDRPDHLNAFDEVLANQLRDHVRGLYEVDGLRCVVVTGNGRAFAAGADLTFVARASKQEKLAFNRVLLDTFELIAELPVPSIAAINGGAFGGGLELALACTMRMAAAGIRLGLPEVRLGILPGAGGTQRLPRLIGTGAASRMLFTGESLSSEEALAVGLVDEVVDPDALRTRSMDLADAVAQSAPLSVRAIKAALDAGLEEPLDEAISRTEALLEDLLDSEDSHEGVTAFVEKRAPEFTGR